MHSRKDSKKLTQPIVKSSISETVFVSCILILKSRAWLKTGFERGNKGDFIALYFISYISAKMEEPMDWDSESFVEAYLSRFPNISSHTIRILKHNRINSKDQLINLNFERDLRRMPISEFDQIIALKEALFALRGERPEQNQRRGQIGKRYRDAFEQPQRFEGMSLTPQMREVLNQRQKMKKE